VRLPIARVFHVGRFFLSHFLLLVGVHTGSARDHNRVACAHSHSPLVAEGLEFLKKS
jgi:hypothetical protein